MRYQDQVVKATQKALDDVLRAVEATPADRLCWSPAPQARSILEQMQEIATSANWLAPILAHGSTPKFGDHAKEETEHSRRDRLELDDCRRQARESTASLCRIVSEFPDERLDQEITLPFGGGVTMTMADAMLLHHWNLTYHLGQISYIQTMFGDMDMH